MAYVITDECVSCGTCAAECPVEAISEGDDKYVIDADTCVDCGTCAYKSGVDHSSPLLLYPFFLPFFAGTSSVTATIFLDC